jgi:dephospho-CoA kinase
MAYRIGFAGKMGSGKTTLANCLVRDMRFSKLSFADSVRYTQKRLFPNRDNDRKLLQDIGMKMREIDKNVWINQVFNYVDIMDKSGNRLNYVIDDVRFINEVDNLLAKGWVVFKLECPLDIRKERLIKSGKPYDGIDSHPSETQLDSITKDNYPTVHFINSNRQVYLIDNDIRSIIRAIGGN